MNPDGPLTDDPVDLAAAFHRVADRLDAISRYGQRNRYLIWGVIAGGIVILGLVAWVGVLTLQNSSQNAEIRSQNAEIRSNQAAIAADAKARQQQGAAVGRKICASFGRLAALKPPAGHGGQQSRVFLGRQHAIFVQIGADLRCPAPRQ